MIRLVFSIFFFAYSTLVFATAPTNELNTSSGDQTSDNLQQEIDKQDIPATSAKKEIGSDDFDRSDGGLYCPNNECSDDPSDVSNGF